MDNQSVNKQKIYGFWVLFDDGAKEGIRYLRDDLQYGESKTLFDAAHLRGSAEFEDDRDRDWTLLYNRGEGTYTLLERQRE